MYEKIKCDPYEIKTVCCNHNFEKCVSFQLICKFGIYKNSCFICRIVDMAYIMVYMVMDLLLMVYHLSHKLISGLSHNQSCASNLISPFQQRTLIKLVIDEMLIGFAHIFLPN